MNRRQFGKTVAIGAAGLLIGFVAFRAEAGQPFMEEKLPGTSIGQTESRWIAPYALATRYRVGQTHVSTVRWFDDKGRVMKELTGNLEARNDFIAEYRPEGAAWHAVYHDVNGRWKVDPPRKPGPSGYICAEGDTFVHQFHPVEGEIAADIYRSGKLIGTVGPFVQYKGRDVHLAGDGSLAFMAWKSPKMESLQVVVVGPDAKVSFTADCGPDVDNPRPIDRGKGVIVEIVGAGEHHMRFRYMRAGGEWIPVEGAIDADTTVSTPDGSGLFFRTSFGKDSRFRLMDTANGKLIWEIPCPVRNPEGYTVSVTVFDDVFLFVGEEFAAVDIKTSEVLGRWTPNVPRTDPGRIARLGDRIFLVTPDEFTEFDFTPADIAAKKYGWR